MNNKKIQEFIGKNKELFWYTHEDKKKEISEQLLIQTILDERSLDDVKELIQIMRIKKNSKVFFSARDRMKLNYYPEIYNYFF